MVTQCIRIGQKGPWRGRPDANSNGLARFRAFTLIELLVVLAILALLLTIATPRYIHHVERAREATLHYSLKVMREAIDKFAGDQGRLPVDLDELVARNYLKAIPVDPITDKRDTWLVLSESDLLASAPANGASTSNKLAPPAPLDPGLADVRSGAPGTGEDGTPFQQW
jgi:prepilin-type N-terminal cleavage/methylation domain-containing protein